MLLQIGRHVTKSYGIIRQLFKICAIFVMLIYSTGSLLEKNIYRPRHLKTEASMKCSPFFS